MVIFQKRIYRSDLRSNPDVLYIFGDNEIRKGLGGQAGEMRGEPNAVGIRTKIYPDTKESSYWNDNNYERQKNLVAVDFFDLLNMEPQKIIIVPSDGLGTGLSELSTRAPRTLKWIEKCIEMLVEKKPAD